MRQALMLKNNEKIPVTADEVLSGKYNSSETFVDPDYEFRLKFVKDSKGHSGPYFRLYYSYEEYKRMHPDRADHYAMVANMRHYKESQWHSGWEEKFSDFCDIEKCIKNPETNKWKFADALKKDAPICFEFQHSYIAWDYEKRTAFYQALGIGIVWLYDLPKAEVIENSDGTVDITEDNSRGFFRISENPENLKKCPVYIQVKNKKIYRVDELLRRPTSSEHKSTIRYFIPRESYSEDEFIEEMKVLKNIDEKMVEVSKAEPEDNKQEVQELKSIFDLWQPNFKTMVVKHEDDNYSIMVNKGAGGQMFRRNRMIQFKYINENGVYDKDYNLKETKAREKRWKLLSYKINSDEGGWIPV